MADITVNAALLQSAASRNSFNIPNKGLVFFGIRGAFPNSPETNSFIDSSDLSFSNINYQKMACTIGQWDVGKKKIATFPGSTVPSLPNIQRSRQKSGVGTNLLMPGRYEYVRGMHKSGKPSGHRAFRQNVFFPVWRSVDNDLYDLQDRIDLGADSSSFVWDNIHSAYASSLTGLYSSAGCQVIYGQPKSPSRGNAPETGPFRVFIDNAYDVFPQSAYVYVLFDAADLALVAQSNSTNVPRIARYGSSGELVRELQTRLVASNDLQGEPDGEFGRNTLAALIAYQKRVLGPKSADGVLGPTTAASLGIVLPLLGTDVASPAPKPAPVTPASEEELEDETDLDPLTVQELLDAFLNGSRPQTIQPQPAQADREDLSRRNFERSQELVRQFEGGYSDDPKDPGGATNFGITIATYAKWKGRPVTKSEVHNMTYDEAKDIYFKEYWSYSSCGKMPGPLGMCIYNLSVHAGPGFAASALQKALNMNGAKVAVDGAIGGETTGAIPTAPLPDLIDDVIELYDAKLRAHKNYAHFAKGFQRRVSLLRVAAEKWLAEDGIAVPALPTPKIDIQGDDSVNQAADNMLRELLASVLQGQGNTTNPTAGASDDKLKTLGSILDVLNSKQPEPQQKELTPVNAMLGQTIGRLLDGRKTAIGGFGAVLSTLLLPTGTDQTATVASIANLIPILKPLTAYAPSLLPIFLGLVLWGALGRQEKNTKAIIENQPPVAK